ncbi:MAG TPA: phosphoribosyltransferase family protein [Pantanalinema sp.]
MHARKANDGEVRVMGFVDRKQAGELLAERLTRYAGPDTVVIGLPRGGVPVAREVAERLNAPLDVLASRKLGAPGNPEFAIGAITARGVRVLNHEALRHLWLPPGYLEQEALEQRRVAESREHLLRNGRAPISLKDKVVILVDDGIATGMTARAAVADVREQGPSKVVLAVPVIAADSVRVLSAEADAVVSVMVPEVFYAVGQFYDRFDQVEDDEVRAILDAARAPASQAERS